MSQASNEARGPCCVDEQKEPSELAKRPAKSAAPHTAVRRGPIGPIGARGAKLGRWGEKGLLSIRCIRVRLRRWMTSGAREKRQPFLMGLDHPRSDIAAAVHRRSSTRARASPARRLEQTPEEIAPALSSSPTRSASALAWRPFLACPVAERALGSGVG